VNVGPDGAIYFADWSNAIIGHMQHHLRDPNRDQQHGRLYRITYEGRPLMEPVKIDGQPIPALLELLKEPENQTRELARLELDKHDSAQVIAAVKKWAAGLDKSDPRYEHHMLEALWMHQWHNVVDRELLARMLKSPESRARAQATRVLLYWRDHIPETLALLGERAVDEAPRVRLEAVRAASFFRSVEAADVALSALKHPTDYYLDYVLSETIRQLQPYWKPALAEGKPVAPNNAAGIDYLVRTLDTSELLKLPRIPAVLQALVTRPGIADADRYKALNELSEQRKVSIPVVLLDTLDATKDADAATTVARLLPQQPAGYLKPVRARIEALLTAPRPAIVRHYALATLATADEGFDTVWSAAAKSPEGLVDVLAAVPLVYDPGVRAAAQSRVMPLLGSTLPSDIPAVSAANGRYVRVELPRKGSLGLGELQVLSGGKNVARQGTASQSSESRAAELAIDGKTDTQSRTRGHAGRGDDVAWLEVDLGSVRPIEAVVIHTPGGRRPQQLERFTVKVLDGDRRPVFTRDDNSTRNQSVQIAVGDVSGDVRRAAIRAAASIQRDPAKTFAALASLIERGEQVPAAAAGIRALPRKAWDESRGPALADALVTWARAVPSDQRTSSEYLSTTQFAQELVTTLPSERAETVVAALRELRVPFFVVGTVREQMRYDTTLLVVEAGKPFEILFENTDFMPHNLTVLNPGSRERVGKAAMLLKPDQLDAQGRAYVPADADILGATKLLENGQKETLKLTAPEKEGEYEYVCTYPDHWQVMWGRLIVTKDIDAYLKTKPSPASPPAVGSTGHLHH
jgi:azurin